MVPRLGHAGLALLILFGVLVNTSMMLSASTVRSETPRIIPQTATDTIGYSGLGPTTVSLTWTESSDVNFTEYVLRVSKGQFGPWNTTANILNRTTTSHYYDFRLIPGGTKWWQVVYHNTTGSQVSNTLQVTQPPVASISYSNLTTTSLALTWNDTALYGGLVSFASYQLMEKVGLGGFSLVATINDVNMRSYALNDLAPGTSYSFYLVTTDQCNACSAASPSSSTSNTVNVSTPGPLGASAATLSQTVDVGQPVSFSCLAAGGVPPYDYSWEFGDGSTGTGNATSHVYSVPGTVNAICTVGDNTGASVNSPASVTVNAHPSIASFTASPTVLDPGERTTFTVSASGSGTLLYSYANLPTGCSSANTNVLLCGPTSSGDYTVTVTLTDHAGESVTATTHLTASSDPEVVSFTATPASFDLGEKIAFSVSANGGHGAMSYSFANLPPGCVSANTTALPCTPSSIGNYRVTVTVTDQTGESATATVDLTVGPQRVLGLPQTLGLALVFAAVAAIGAVAVTLSALRRRSVQHSP